MAPIYRLLCTLVVVTAALLVQKGDSTGVIMIELKTFSKSNTSGCRGDTGAVCEPIFTICQERYNRYYPYDNRCVNSSANNHEVYYFKRFNSTIDGMANPVEFEYVDNTTSGNVVIYIDDYNKYGYNPNLATFHIYEGSVSSMEMNGSRDFRFHNYTTALDLDVTVTLVCNSYYYGNGCSVYCNSSWQSHYWCDDDGSKRCHDGYHGVDCDEMYPSSSPCNYNPCDRGTCYTTDTKPHCQCPGGYYGSRCQYEYTLTSPGLSNRCHYSNPCYRGTCYNTGYYDYRCNCPYQYTGKRCEYRIYNTTSTTETTTTTTPPNPCYYSNPCYRGTCYNIGYYDYRCNCPYDYTGKRCEYWIYDSTTSPNTPKTTTPPNPCYYSNPCYRGTCYNIGYYDYRCNCPYDYTGKRCEYSIYITTAQPPTMRNPCHYYSPCHRGTCYATGNYDYRCDCPYGYTGKHCEYLIYTTSTPPLSTTRNPCFPNPCYRGTCLIRNEYNYFCDCYGGFHGSNCDVQTTVENPCHRTHCQNSGTCVPVGDNFICYCAQGYSGRYCERHPCFNKHCLHGGLCRVTSDIGVCVCPSFYTGDMCQNNPCSGFTCYNGGLCTLESGYPKCRCPPGYNGTLCEHAEIKIDPCVGVNCLYNGTCIQDHTSYMCKCRSGFSGLHCQNVDASGCGMVKNCRQCTNEGECMECHDGYDLVSGACVECPLVTPILHCEKEARTGCLFRHCEQCEPGFFRLGSGCDVCPDVDVGCRDVTCTSSADSRCIKCHPGFYLVGNTCLECPSPISNCEKATCTNRSDAHCMTCKDGYIFYNNACVLCPSREIIPDCLDIGRDGCFDKWCRKCASGFFLKGTVCDVCPNEDVGCEHVQCNATHDAHCILCHHGYILQNGKCVRYHTGSPTPSSNVCEDHPDTDCSYLHSTIKLCEDTTRACQYCPQYCGMCDRCRYKHFGPVIG